MKKQYNVYCMDNDLVMIFLANSAHEAMQKTIYYLNISRKDNSTVKISDSGETLFIVHNGLTYACKK